MAQFLKLTNWMWATGFYSRQLTQKELQWLDSRIIPSTSEKICGFFNAVNKDVIWPIHFTEPY